MSIHAIHSHRELAEAPILGVACRILRCDLASRPKACVLLLASMGMMIVTLLATLAGTGL